MKARFALIVAVAQALVLIFMAGQREWISRTGTPLTLRTAPVDPDDPMRGAYVRLDYEIGMVPAILCKGALSDWMKLTDYREQQRLRDRIVYTSLKINSYGIAEPISVSDVRPVDGSYLRGRVQSIDARGIRVRYGVEALFMSKAAAQKMEAMTRNEKAGAPIDAHIVTGPSGISVLKDYAWEPLGLTIAFDRPPPRNDRNSSSNPESRGLTGVTLTLHNYSDGDLAIVDLPNAGSFRLVANTRFSANHYTWTGARDEGERVAPQAGDIIVLKPGATRQVHLDFTQPQWSVIDTKNPGSAPMTLQQLPDRWSASFRIEYAPSDANDCRDLPHANLIRHVPLYSRAFNANQGID